MQLDQTHRYYSLNDYCRETFGEKVYRLSLDGGFTCPNRDGTLDTKGCAFCSAGGSGDFASDRRLSIALQLKEAQKRIQSKSNATRFIAYFQAFTGTYAPVLQLEQLYTEAMEPDSVAALSIATRPDCINPEVVSLIRQETCMCRISSSNHA